MLKKNLFKKVSSAVLAMCFFVCLDFGCLAMYPNAEKNPNEDEFGIGSDEIEVAPEGDGTNRPSYEEHVIELIKKAANKKLGNEFGISTSDESEDEPDDHNYENEIKMDSNEGYLPNGLSIEYLVRTISEEANRMLKNGKDINDVNETEDKFKISTSDESEDEPEDYNHENEPNDVNESADKQEIETGKDEVTMSDGGVYSFGSSESNEYENSQNELNDKESTKNYFKARTPKISEFVLNDQSKADVYSDEAVLPLGSEEENE